MTLVPAPREIFEELSDQLNKFQLLMNLEDKDSVEELNLKEAKINKLFGKYGHLDIVVIQISLAAIMGKNYEVRKRDFTLDIFINDRFDSQDDSSMLDSNVSNYDCTYLDGFEWNSIGEEAFGIDDIKNTLIEIGFMELFTDAQLINAWEKEYVNYLNDKYKRDILPFVPGAKSVSYVTEDKVEIILENNFPIYSSTSSVYHNIELFKEESKK